MLNMKFSALAACAALAVAIGLSQVSPTLADTSASARTDYSTPRLGALVVGPTDAVIVGPSAVRYQVGSSTNPYPHTVPSAIFNH